MPDMNENRETQQEYFGVHTDNKETLQNALKRIKELEAQINKMKNCANCRHFSEPYKLCCYGLGDEVCRGRKWEIKEND